MALSKKQKGLIITLGIILAVGIVFLILLFTSQKDEVKKFLTGEPAKDAKTIVEMICSSPEKVKEYLEYFDNEYVDEAKKADFTKELEVSLANLELKPLRDPAKDAEACVRIFFLLESNMELCMERGNEFFFKVQFDEFYEQNPAKFEEFKKQMNIYLGNEGTSLADIGLE